jgi:hypothetical protein
MSTPARSPGEVSELDRRRSTDLLDVVVRPGPIPEAMVSVNIRSISPYSAGTPASTLPWIDTSRSKLSRGPYRSDATVAAAARRHEEQRPRPRAEQVPLACAKSSPLIYTPWGSLVSL